MARLPNVGGDSGNWGTILNDYLKVGHRDDGSLKSVGNVVNVIDYGAVGNGDSENPADDTESINKAIAALENGSVLYFPAGKTFKITKALDAIGKERVHITGGGTISALGVSGYVFTIGSKQVGGLQNCKMSGIRILIGEGGSGVKWYHAQSFVMDGVHVEGVLEKDSDVGVEVINGCYQGVIRHCKIAGRFMKGVWIRRGDEEEPFNVAPHGVHVLGCWLSRLAPARVGEGLVVDGSASGVRSIINYYESWDTGIHITRNAIDGFKSISDTFEDDKIGVNVEMGRVVVLYPTLNPGSDSLPEVGVDFSNGAYSSDGAVVHLTRNVVPSIALVRISAGCLRTRLEMEQALIDNNIVDNGGETVYYGQDKIRLGDVNIYRSAVDILKTDDKLIAGAGMGVGNSADATTLGAVKKKIEIFDASGNSLGFIPVYDSIS